MDPRLTSTVERPAPGAAEPPRPPVTSPADPVAAYGAARASRCPRERLLAQLLDTVSSLVPVAGTIAFTVDERGLAESVMLLPGATHSAADIRGLLGRLRALEPIDPFSPRRAADCGASVLSAADAGGPERLARSMYGRHLRRYGVGAPLVAYFRRDGRIVAGVALLRGISEPPFDAKAVRLLARLQPMLEQALAIEHPPPPAPQADPLGDDRLTAREREVAALVGAGASNGMIADALHMSEATVKTHLTRIYAKLGVRTRTQLALLLGVSGASKS